MLFIPTAAASQAPAVDNVPVQHELFAVSVLEKKIHLINLTIISA